MVKSMTKYMVGETPSYSDGDKTHANCETKFDTNDETCQTIKQTNRQRCYKPKEQGDRGL